MEVGIATAPSTPPESSYALLGLIDKLPSSSGHELATAADRSFAHFWPISRTLLYRELSRLVRLNWVTATRVEQTRVPSKWIYLITQDGEQALAAWLSRPVGMAGSYRNDVLLRIFFAHRMSPDQVTTLLEDYREMLQAQRVEFAALVDKLSSISTPSARVGRVSALHGLRTVEARLDWIDEARAELFDDDMS